MIQQEAKLGSGKRHIWVCEVTWRRRKGKPVEPIAMTCGGMLQALFLAKGCAEKLKVPQSWVNPVLYRRADRKEKANG